MPTVIRTAEPRLSPRQTVKFVCLAVRLRYLTRRLNRASDEEAAAILRAPLLPEAARVRRSIIKRWGGATGPSTFTTKDPCRDPRKPACVHTSEHGSRHAAIPLIRR